MSETQKDGGVYEETVQDITRRIRGYVRYLAVERVETPPKRQGVCRFSEGVGPLEHPYLIAYAEMGLDPEDDLMYGEDHFGLALSKSPVLDEGDQTVIFGASETDPSTLMILQSREIGDFERIPNLAMARRILRLFNQLDPLYQV